MISLISCVCGTKKDWIKFIWTEVLGVDLQIELHQNELCNEKRKNDNATALIEPFFNILRKLSFFGITFNKSSDSCRQL